MLTTLKPFLALYPDLTDMELRVLAVLAAARGLTAADLAVHHSVAAEIEREARAVAAELGGTTAARIAGALASRRDPDGTAGPDHWLAVGRLLADPSGPLATIAVEQVIRAGEDPGAPDGEAVIGIRWMEYLACDGDGRDQLVRLGAAIAGRIAAIDAGDAGDGAE